MRGLWKPAAGREHPERITSDPSETSVGCLILTIRLPRHHLTISCSQQVPYKGSLAILILTLFFREVSRKERAYVSLLCRVITLLFPAAGWNGNHNKMAAYKGRWPQRFTLINTRPAAAVTGRNALCKVVV